MNTLTLGWTDLGGWLKTLIINKSGLQFNSESDGAGGDDDADQDAAAGSGSGEDVHQVDSYVVAMCNAVHLHLIRLLGPSVLDRGWFLDVGMSQPRKSSPYGRRS